GRPPAPPPARRGAPRRPPVTGAVTLTDPAVDDLRRAGPALAAAVVAELAVLADTPDRGVPLVDPDTGYRTLALHAAPGRVVYDVVADTVTVRVVWIDGRRGDGAALGEALTRMQAADPVELVSLARIVQAFARLTGTRPGVDPRDEPVPDWLAEALLATGAVDHLGLTAMDGRQAFATYAAASRAT